MKIKELKEGQSNVELEANAIEVTDSRTVNSKFGGQLRVANATLQDDSGTIELVLWNDAIDKVSAGDKIKITGGFVKAWNGKLQLTVGKMGSIEVV